MKTGGISTCEISPGENWFRLKGISLIYLKIEWQLRIINDIHEIISGICLRDRDYYDQFYYIHGINAYGMPIFRGLFNSQIVYDGQWKLYTLRRFSDDAKAPYKSAAMSQTSGYFPLPVGTQNWQTRESYTYILT